VADNRAPPERQDPNDETSDPANVADLIEHEEPMLVILVISKSLPKLALLETVNDPDICVAPIWVLPAVKLPNADNELPSKAKLATDMDDPRTVCCTAESVFWHRMFPTTVKWPDILTKDCVEILEPKDTSYPTDIEDPTP
jgi:hypothetical protein